MLPGLEYLPEGTSISSARFLVPMPTHFNPVLGGTHTAVIIDVETTGLDTEKDEITSFSWVKFKFSDKMKITSVESSGTYFNEPMKVPISDEITELTGITHEMVKGHVLTEDMIHDVVHDVEIVFAHNAPFDKKMLLRYYQKKLLHWSCTYRELDLRKMYKLTSKTLSHILIYLKGFYFAHHDSLEDCWATFWLLEYEDHLKTILKSAYTPEYVLYAWNSEFMKRDILKDLGFRWNNGVGVWYLSNISKDKAEEISLKIKDFSRPEIFQIPFHERFLDAR